MPGPNRAPRGGYAKPKNMAKTIRRLVGYLTKSKLPLVAVFLFLMLSVFTNLGGSYMMRDIINSFIWSGCTDFAGLALSVGKLVGVYLIGCVATYCQSAVMVRLAQRGVNRLRKDLFDSLQSLPLSYFDKHPHGELMSRFTNDADNVQMALEQSVVSLCSSCLMFVGLVAMMLFINWKLFLVTALLLIVTVYLFRTLGGRSRKYYQQQQSALGDVNGEIQEIIEGLKVVKAFTHEEQAKEDFRKLNTAYRDAAQKANFYSIMIMPVSGNLMNISYALTAAFGGLLSVLQGFDLGGLVVYLNYSKQVGQPLNQISQQMTTLLSALAGAERIFDVMDTKPEVDEGTVTLIEVEKDANGTLSPFNGKGHSHTWAWKTPRTSGMALVPVLAEGDVLTELGQAVREKTGLKLLLPGEDSPDGIWVRVAADGTLIEVQDLASLAGHGWAWKYPDHNHNASLHLIRGAVRNVPGEDYYLTELKGAVRFSHVDFSYVPGKRILHDVSVYANPGQKIAFVGSTGAGKTTITNLINRFYEIEGGMITYDGINVRSIRKDDLRRSLGAVLQDTHLFTGTIMDNIRYGRLDATDEECIAAAKSANAHSFIRRLPDGYNTMVTGDGANLSQGQRQLLAIARAAVADPPVMILDEATSSIDTRTEALIQKGMDALMDGRTVFVIAHRLSTVRNSNCIVVIEHGEIEEKGSHDQLLEKRGRYYRLYTGQFQLS
ncbi:ABC transporter ATP-binding protein/permease [Lawsonibacter sp. OA9]|uniref:ABC transporter ATP-binding protein n=2 Tax=Flintibacter hominis TaxID=2763048 RepID=A0A8J6J8Q2_9FIRM|nr:MULTISPECIES: ABC transporter ATP-binding protein [Oscillospiraceae]MBC5721982.1 ABC transporter ATP-binding protein [Flintibacter hominis]SCH63892.1 Putative multidrug export ATP-binding/permease protein SAV1866 [uncultured Clostridium sp.]SCI88771.1 Putative multidrug export ATP-binding/permease protein SAV1866 [uncultured Flavonifractor sp.]MCH1980610.1 ABC transporter ATP-binding protein/permease [Lawsonibacter sp. OA9]MCU6702074.1 ABC transporter ATP-binding protein/permease [Muriventr